ncbi:MAG: hypothetical protein R3358_03660, partial [Woeseiaceae bacterium]|nr:hypothetical protein [Woeseiaceae bacterium]
MNRAGERYYCIYDVDEIRPFFISLISSDDHWQFISSTGGLTCGRVSPGTALFPYVSVDKVHESLTHTGPRTIVRLHHADGQLCWEPFNREQRGRYAISRNLYKSTLGDKLCFEETNHDLGLVFRYTWSSSADYGFVRDCELQNVGAATARVDIVDGLQNILPAGTPRHAQANSSNLVDAYKWTELDEQTGLALFTLYSGITDRAEPCESLAATTAFCLGLDNPTILVSNQQLDAFRDGHDLTTERHKRGIRGAYFVAHSEALLRNQASSWRFVLEVEQSQTDVVQLRQTLLSDNELDDRITTSIANGSDELASIMASADAFQSTAEEVVTVHHYANVMFNVLRGGIVADQYNILTRDFRRTVRNFNRPVYDRNSDLLDGLPERLRSDELLSAVRGAGDKQLTRLALEYLPITFGRRHGDPSRPWNEFAIHLKDENGEGLLSYQGNWRDIFQNWEALAFSYPEFAENMIAKFVNASTIDGYNPYRITKAGIDWEVEDADDPWSYIGYWGDHQIIYLLKLLELSRSFHPKKLHELLREPVFCYANVPYRIKPLEQLLDDPKNTVVFDDEAARKVDERVAALGADGKLIPDAAGEIYQVNLLEKLLVPLLAKLGNLVLDGGIWLNTQRPEWNDANNALVGQGLSMVTLYYMRRYVSFLLDLLDDDSGTFTVTSDVDAWISDTAAALGGLRADLDGSPDFDVLRYRSLRALGNAAAEFRRRVYAQDSLGDTCERGTDSVRELLADASAIIDHSIAANRRDDRLFHAYNIASFNDDTITVSNLYPMLEGQVAALSAGTADANDVVDVVDALYASKIYRADQNSFMLYPDRDLPGFLERNRLPEDRVRAIPLLEAMLERGDRRVVVRDAEGCLRFNSSFRNAGDLEDALDRIGTDAGAADRKAIFELYESVFRHSEFTGRSGTMFGFEGLGSIYWHMVSKLLLAVAENFYDALDSDVAPAMRQRLGELYYRIRSGIGFNKTPAQYGAFPCDPYSHTPKHAGARQPGMTGQVKEEVLTRFAELGIRVHDGCVFIRPALLRACEFAADPRPFCYLDVAGNWQTVELPASSLAFTWCQVPFIYRLGEASDVGLAVELDVGGHIRSSELSLPVELCADLYARNGSVRSVTVTL